MKRSSVTSAKTASRTSNRPPRSRAASTHSSGPSASSTTRLSSSSPSTGSASKPSAATTSDAPLTALPATLGACADLLYTTRQQRYEIGKQIKTLQALEAALSSKLIDELPKSDSTGVAGSIASVQIVTRKVPTVSDLDKVLEWVDADKKHRSNFIAPRALNLPALQELIDNDEPLPPGAEVFIVVKPSIHKLKES